MKQKICYVYMIECKNFTYYTGIADNYEKRWEQHKSGFGSKYIKANGFLQPVYLEICNNKSAAMKRERQIKKMSKKQKVGLLTKEINLWFEHIL